MFFKYINKYLKASFLPNWRKKIAPKPVCIQHWCCKLYLETKIIMYRNIMFVYLNIEIHKLASIKFHLACFQSRLYKMAINLTL